MKKQTHTIYRRKSVYSDKPDLVLE